MIGRFLLMATDNGALATSAIGWKSLVTEYATDFIVMGALTKVEALNRSV